mgnify:CR=1 FL=1
MLPTTQTTKATDIKRTWYLIDAKDKVVGRIATDIAKKLMGKNKTHFVRNLDCGDYVVVTNAKYITITGNKALQKTYYRHSMYPGGFKAERFEELLVRKPEDIIIHAVKGMLPQNKLRDKMLKRLLVYKDESHPFEKKFIK